MPAPVLLEVCVATLEDALAARAGGADRLELNSALALGGLTPSLGLLIEARQTVTLPLVALLRPRPGGFCYGTADFKVMERDLDLLLEHGADAVALGVLTEDGEIDARRCRQLLRRLGPQEAVFHRAFDVVPDPFAALEQLVDLGFRRVMSSGQEENAYNGAPIIAELLLRAAGRIEVLPAGGINRFNVEDVIARTGCTQVHASLRGPRLDRSMAAQPQVSFAAAVRPAEDRHDGTSVEAVAGLRALLGR
jgi:copper homeostasis protein